MARPYLSVIVPSYNEAERLPLTLLDVDKYLSAADYAYEILVVDDYSEDNTARIAENLAKMMKHLRVIKNDEHRGRGAASRQGLLLSRGKVRLLYGAGGEAPIEQLGGLLQHVSSAGGLGDVIVGSRLMQRGRAADGAPLTRKVADFLASVFARLFVVGGVKDALSGFKIFTSDAAEKIIHPTRISGGGWDLEVLALAQKAGLTVKEVPVEWNYNPKKTPALSSCLHILADTVKIRWWLYRRKYGSI